MEEASTEHIEIMLLCPATGEASIVTVDQQTQLGALIFEYTSCAQQLEDDAAIVDFMSGNLLHASQTVQLAELRDGDILVIGSPQTLIVNDAALPFVYSLEEASERVRAFDHISHVPDFFLCSVSSEQFDQLLWEATADLNFGEGAFGGRELIMDMMRSVDSAYRAGRGLHASEDLIFRLRAIMEHVHDTYGSSSERFVHRVLGRHEYPSSDARDYHLVCNAAALHAEPTLADARYLTERMTSGEVEVGDISVDAVTATDDTNQRVALADFEIDEYTDQEDQGYGQGYQSGIHVEDVDTSDVEESADESEESDEESGGTMQAGY